MNDNAKKWVAALRSGEYEQGAGSLNNNGKLCCLGVACELAIKSGVPLIASESYRGSSVKMYNEEMTILPIEVKDWLGMQDRGGTYKNANQLTVDNDNGKTFAQIADIIESEPEGLFL